MVLSMCECEGVSFWDAGNEEQEVVEGMEGKELKSRKPLSIVSIFIYHIHVLAF